MNYYQTGDVLYKMIDAIDTTEAREIEGSLVHRGDNHHHRIEGVFVMFTVGDEFYVNAFSECSLTHEEHHTVVIPPGLYLKDIVREYDHFKEESRQVVD